MAEEIKELTREEGERLYLSKKKEGDRHTPLGLFFYQVSGKTIAIDNREGYAWTGVFTSKRRAKAWLRGEEIPQDRNYEILGEEEGE